ncbi:MAG TPA: non-canonical purine NTP pyrophosphatase [Thermoanaerobaculia bacterium]|nr:non-canonical purine NTP pyrophosphatase [Thermoanaerobaculia bacterium]
MRGARRVPAQGARDEGAGLPGRARERLLKPEPGPSGLLLVTGNPGKLAEARRLAGRPLEAVALDLPEIQSLDLEEVLRAKSSEAHARVGRPLVVEETGLELDALGGFPGPLVRWMLEAVGAEGIARTALALGDARARAVCLLAWTDGERTVLGRGATRGELVLPPRGTNGFGWDPVFRPDGEELTYAEMSDAGKDALGHRGRAWRDLLSRL